MGCHALLRGVFPSQGSNPSLLHLLHWQVVSEDPKGSLAHQRYKPLKRRNEPSDGTEKEGECRRGPRGGLQWESDLSGY